MTKLGYNREEIIQLLGIDPVEIRNRSIADNYHHFYISHYKSARETFKKYKNLIKRGL